MPFADLRSFVAELEARDQLRRVTAEVDPILEISEIAGRMMKSPCPEGPAGAPATDPAHGGSGGSQVPFSIAQNRQSRVQQSPRIINVAVIFEKQSQILGHLASWQTV